jgi:hypothetical protein
MFGHRTHNEVLQLQGESNQLRTEATRYEVEKSNLYAWYQAKKLRQAQYEISSSMVGLFPGENEARDKYSKDWKEKADKYNKKEEKDSLPELDARGTEAAKKAEEFKVRAEEVRHEAEYVHKRADRVDIGHLLAEVSLVLCSITLLTKKRLFWHIGLSLALIAVVLTLSVYTIPREQAPEHKSHALEEMSYFGDLNM